MSSTDP